MIQLLTSQDDFGYQAVVVLGVPLTLNTEYVSNDHATLCSKLLESVNGI